MAAALFTFPLCLRSISSRFTSRCRSAGRSSSPRRAAPQEPLGSDASPPSPLALPLLTKEVLLCKVESAPAPLGTAAEVGTGTPRRWWTRLSPRVHAFPMHLLRPRTSLPPSSPSHGTPDTIPSSVVDTVAPPTAGMFSLPCIATNPSLILHSLCSLRFLLLDLSWARASGKDRGRPNLGMGSGQRWSSGRSGGARIRRGRGGGEDEVGGVHVGAR